MIPSSVTQVDATEDIRAHSTLARIDYADAFEVVAGTEISPAQWAHATLEDAPQKVRYQLIASWMAMGLNLRPWESARVLGWGERTSSSEKLLLGADSRLGLHGELLFLSRPGGVLFSTLIQLSNPVAALAWKRIIPPHVTAVTSLFRHSAKRVSAGARPQTAA